MAADPKNVRLLRSAERRIPAITPADAAPENGLEFSARGTGVGKGMGTRDAATWPIKNGLFDRVPEKGSSIAGLMMIVVAIIIHNGSACVGISRGGQFLGRVVTVAGRLCDDRYQTSGTKVCWVIGGRS